MDECKECGSEKLERLDENTVICEDCEAFFEKESGKKLEVRHG